MSDFEKEWAKMLSGEVYDAFHEGFAARLTATRDALWEFNGLRPSDVERQQEILRGLLGSCGEKLHVNQPFRCDYGCNIHVGENFFANFNLTILDEAEVRMGSNVFIGPNVSIYTACHPLDAAERDTWVEWAEPVTIGDSVWIGGNAVILPGVRIGSRSVVAAGAVVTRDVPEGMVVAGNPARVIKPAR
ncbi:MAG: sugar O-acetyltransferase [Muribaculaceae bacterium]|nr:sugar O-acetyltransferase [Muribaculaceae bacterium]